MNKTRKETPEDLDKLFAEGSAISLERGTYHLTADSKIRFIIVEKGVHLYLEGHTVVERIYVMDRNLRLPKEKTGAK